MTISESLIQWLKQFNTDVTINNIDIDRLQASGGSYGLYKMPSRNTVDFINGNQERTDFFQFQAKISNITDNNRKNAQKFFSDLEEWIYQKNLSEDLPQLTNYTCIEVTLSDTFYMSEALQKESKYIFGISIRYQ